MYRKLNKQEVKEFEERYMQNCYGEANEVLLMDLHGLKTYLVNGHYLVMVLGNKVVESDLQFV